MFTTTPPVRTRQPQARSPRGQSKEDSMEHTQGRRPVFELEEEREAAKIKVIGLGGGRSNTGYRTIAATFTSLDFLVATTYTHALTRSTTPSKIANGSRRTT